MCSTHDGRAECFACSDTQPWYAGARHQEALLCDCKRHQPSEELIEALSAHTPGVCIDCGRRVVKGPRCGSCGQQKRWDDGKGSPAPRSYLADYGQRYAGRP